MVLSSAYIFFFKISFFCCCCFFYFFPVISVNIIKCWALSGSILFENLLVFLKDIFLENNYLERKFSRGQQQPSI